MENSLDINCIINELRKTYSPISNEKRKQSQACLQQYSKNSMFLQCLCKIVTSTLQQQIKTASTIYIVNYVKSITASSNQNFIYGVTQKILILLQKNIRIQLKMQLLKAFNYIFQSNWKVIIQKTLLAKLYQQIDLEKEKEVNYLRYQYLILFAHLMISEIQNQQLIYDEFLKYTFDKYILLNRKTLQLLSRFSEFNIQQKIKIFDLLRQFAHLFKLIYSTINFEKNKGFLRFLSNEHIHDIINQGLSIEISEDQFKKSNNMKQGVYIACQINRIKQNYVSMLNRIYHNLCQLITQAHQLKINIFYFKRLDYLNIILNRVIQLMAKTKFYLLPEENVQYIHSFLKILSQFLPNNETYSYYYNTRSIIIQNILFPLLEFTQNDKSNLIQNPQEFSNMLELIIDYQQQTYHKQQDSIKCTVAKSIVLYCRYQDGVLTQLVQNAMSSILKNINNRQQYLLLLAIVNKVSQNRPEIIMLVKNYIENQVPSLFTQNFEGKKLNKSMLIQKTMKLKLIQKYQKSIQKIDGGFVKNISLKVISKIFSRYDNPQIKKLADQQIIQIISLKILYHVVLIDTQLMILNNLNQVREVLTFLNNLIRIPNITHRIYDVIYLLIKENQYISQNLSQTIINCINLLVSKIEQQTNSNSPNHIVINKSWNIIRQISQNPIFANILDQIQVCVYPLVKHFQKIQNIQFEEDLVLLTITFIKQRKKINQLELNFFQYIPKIFNKYGHEFSHLFELINLYLFYGSEYFKNSKQALYIILDMSILSIFSKRKYLVDEASNCQGILILQNLIIECGECLNHEIWKKIVQKIYERLAYQNIKKSFIKANLVIVLGLVILRNFENLQKQDSIKIMLQHLLQGSDYCRQTYSIKIYVLILTSLLMFYNNHHICQLYPIMLQSIIIKLRIAHLQKQNDQLNEIQFDDQDRYYCISKEMFHCKLNFVDEFENFQNTIRDIETKNNQILEYATTRITPINQQYLKKLKKFIKISNFHRQIITVKRT